jgi:purine-cytosine permease-like protein
MQARNLRTKLLRGLAISGTLSVLFVTVVTIAAELYPPLKNWLASTFTHHWVGKGVIAMAIFFLLGLLLGFLWRSERIPTGLLMICAWVAILGTVAISGFYVYEAFFVTH